MASYVGVVGLLDATSSNQLQGTQDLNDQVELSVPAVEIKFRVENDMEASGDGYRTGACLHHLKRGWL